MARSLTLHAQGLPVDGPHELPVGDALLVDFDALSYRDWRRWPTAPHFVYLLLDADEEIFYVGRTGDPRGRMGAHRSRRGFGHRPRYVHLTACASKESASDIEVHLIRRLQPSGNDQHCIVPRKIAH